MKFLILALLLLTLQDSSPPKAGNKSGDQSQKDTKQKQTVATPSPRQSPANTPDQDTQRTKDQSQNNEVKVSTLPDKIRIQPIKDTIDWTVLGCTIALTFVGIAGTIVALKTLFAIERQATIMEEHRVSLEELAKAANKNAGAAEENAAAVQNSVDMFISKERARIRVEIGHFKFEIDEAHTIPITVKHFGPTDAFITETGISVFFTPPYTDEFEPRPIPVPNELFPSNREFRYPVLIDKGRLSDKEIDDVDNGALTLNVRGFIKYTDVFDRKRETVFCFIWRAIGMPSFRGFWEAPPEHNYET